MSTKTPAYSEIGLVNRADAQENAKINGKSYVDPIDVGGPVQQVPPVISGNAPYTSNSKDISGPLGFYIPHLSVGLDTGRNSYVQQSAKDECNILNILKQYNQTGIINHSNPQSPIFTDLPDNIDYQEALAMVKEGESAFASLPSTLRRFFGDDPERFLAALYDPSMKDKLIEFGIFEKPVPPLGGTENPAPPPVPVSPVDKTP